MQDEIITPSKNTKKAKIVRVYVDGSSHLQTKSAGWGCVVVQNGQPKSSSGTLEGTNNLAELTGFITGLGKVLAIQTNSSGIVVARMYSDSSYVLKELFEFTLSKRDVCKLVGSVCVGLDGKLDLTGWSRSRFPKTHVELWVQCFAMLDLVAKNGIVYFYWIRGHQSESTAPPGLRMDVARHNLADKLAESASATPTMSTTPNKNI
jgi:ribonuclease HI